MLPWLLQTTPSHMKSLGILSIIVLAYMMAVIMIQSPQYMVLYPSVNIPLFRTSEPFEIWRFMGLYFYSYTSIISFHHARST